MNFLKHLKRLKNVLDKKKFLLGCKIEFILFKQEKFELFEVFKKYSVKSCYIYDQY